MKVGSPQRLIGYLLLFGMLYLGFDVQSPYVPRLLKERGPSPEAIGVLAAGTAIRLAAGPAAGRLADRRDAACLVFAALTVVLLQGAALAPLAPLAPLADAIVLVSAGPVRTGFDYGWMRGAGSAAFIVGAILSSQLIGHLGLSPVIFLNGATQRPSNRRDRARIEFSGVRNS